MMEDIKPCPFCGGIDLVHERQGPSAHYIYCDGCRCEGPGARLFGEAIKLWNTRDGKMEETDA